MTEEGDLVAALAAGDERALARAITLIENREPGYRDVVADCHRRAGDARVLGVTGSPGAGKSTLVDRLVAAYRDRDLSVGVVAVDPSSPFSGGAVLGDRVRMGAAAGDPGVFVRSMSARGAAGGLSAATADAVTAMDAAGFDRVVVETVGAGQSEVEVMRTADTVAVLVPPGSGDDVQMLKAGILEIGDVFVVNKADLEGADRTVRELKRMLDRRAEARSGDGDGDDGAGWTPPVVETVATTGDGVDSLVATLDDHYAFLVDTGALADGVRERYAATIRAVLREEAAALVASELDRRGGLDTLAQRVADRETDPYQVVDAVVAPIEECLEDGRQS